MPLIGSTFRPTGFFNEPSTYFSIVFTFVVIRYFLKERLEIIDKLALLSFFLTLSFAAVILSILFIAFLNIKGRRLFRFLPFFFFLVILSLPFLFELFEARTSGDYDAIGIRENLFQVLFDQPFIEIVFGNGPVGVPSAIAYLYQLESTSWAKNGFAAINDNGLIIFIFMKFGLVGLFSLFYFVYLKTRSIRITLVLTLVFLTKIKLTSLMFILFIGVILIYGRGKADANKLTY
ncbi:hypothetical protein [Chania multitudinisentens]|nr:hypothetical protein [Chania multitudinisentens]